jgi:ornithine cyclodeaminase/alanine dehydrogenase-like protein (mu-crystallin family)
VDDLRHLTHFICSRLPLWPTAQRVRAPVVTAAPAGGTRILTRRDIAALMRPTDYRRAVARAFAALAEGRGASPAPMHLAGSDGGFHVKGAGFAAGELAPGGRAYVAIKVNGNFPANPARRGLPTIQGAIVLSDGETGQVLAVMDSIEVTLQRTAAASAVAATHLARRDSAVVTVCGCGEQARAQLIALRDVLPITDGFAWDRDPARADGLVRVAAGLGISLAVADDLRTATRQSDVIVTCTTATAPFLTADHVAPGTFIAAVGADSPAKSEIAPELMARASVVTDLTGQCLAMGDLRHAVAARAMTAAQVLAELGEVVGGRRPGRTHPHEITLFDSTGVAVQDVASAAALYERACAAGVGLAIDLGGPPDHWTAPGLAGAASAAARSW